MAACWIVATAASAQSPPLQSVALFNNSDLTGYAVMALRQWTFTPAMLNGRPVPVLQMELA